SPCALAVAAIPATLAGISSLAKQGILFKGGNFLSNLINLKAVAFDKTGTLTEGKPKVVDFYFNPELDGESFRNTLVAMEKQSNHPLANAKA
ncbi:HAD family hydrolase, partial [Streptococcus agalactiae]|uniref:HAD family hydrolase n=1 Tax=Streptococcus agalactiae TaxID=1311 RepID=UPI00115601E0